MNKIILQALEQEANPEKAAFFPRFFKTGPGEYGEGDQFLGVTVPKQRAIAKRFHKQCSLSDIEELLQNPIHECRLTALFLLIHKYEKSKSITEKSEIVTLYLRNTKYVNNWDLVDSSAYKILGPHLFQKDSQLLFDLAQSKLLWDQRIAMITTYYFIKKDAFEHTLALAEILLFHPHDLMHKAVGWMLREIGNRNFELEFEFLKMHYHQMPRTMLRYAIEKFPEDLRQDFLKGRV